MCIYLRLKKVMRLPAKGIHPQEHDLLEAHKQMGKHYWLH